MPINGLPFSSEGYVRAKNSITTKNGKQSEVENTRISLAGLQNMSRTHPWKLCEFYDKLTINFQALERIDNSLKPVGMFDVFWTSFLQ